jgi:hypothetical protein
MVGHDLPADPAAAWGFTMKAIFFDATNILHVIEEHPVLTKKTPRAP